MTVGICGLGLIGGSMARAYKEGGHTVYGYDKNTSALGYAMLSDICAGELNDNTIGECDLLFVALYPNASIEYMNAIAPSIVPSATAFFADSPPLQAAFKLSKTSLKACIDHAKVI